MYPQGYQHSHSDKELISLFLSSKEKYHFSPSFILLYNLLFYYHGVYDKDHTSALRIKNTSESDPLIYF